MRHHHPAHPWDWSENLHENDLACLFDNHSAMQEIFAGNPHHRQEPAHYSAAMKFVFATGYLISLISASEQGIELLNARTTLAELAVGTVFGFVTSLGLTTDSVQTSLNEILNTGEEGASRWNNLVPADKRRILLRSVAQAGLSIFSDTVLTIYNVFYFARRYSLSALEKTVLASLVASGMFLTGLSTEMRDIFHLELENLYEAHQHDQQNWSGTLKKFFANPVNPLMLLRETNESMQNLVDFRSVFGIKWHNLSASIAASSISLLNMRPGFVFNSRFTREQICDLQNRLSTHWEKLYLLLLLGTSGYQAWLAWTANASNASTLYPDNPGFATGIKYYTGICVMPGDILFILAQQDAFIQMYGNFAVRGMRGLKNCFTTGARYISQCVSSLFHARNNHSAIDEEKPLLGEPLPSPQP